jgi:hypothetical protein
MKLSQFSLCGLFLLLGLVGVGLGWWPATLPQEPIDLSADDLNVPLDPQQPFTAELLPPRLRNLEGYRVRIVGFVTPGFGKQFTQFLLNTEPPLMTYGGFPPPDTVVAVQLQPDRSASYTPRPVVVTGVLRFEEYRADKELVLFYRLNEASLEPTTLPGW